MKKIYVCSPLRDDNAAKREQNRLAAIGYCEMVKSLFPKANVAAPHAYVSLMLSDKVPVERSLLSVGRPYNT